MKNGIVPGHGVLSGEEMGCTAPMEGEHLKEGPIYTVRNQYSVGVGGSFQQSVQVEGLQS